MNWNKTKRLVKKPLYRVYESRILKFLDRDKLPRHIGVIHDGHRRYARAEGLPDYETSYREGMRKFVEFLGWAEDLDEARITALAAALPAVKMVFRQPPATLLRER